MKKTKILCTIGPSSKDLIKELLIAGADAFRINLSHGDRNQWLEIINSIREVTDKTPILVDTRGPEIRIINITKPIEVKPNDLLKFSTKPVTNLPYITNEVSISKGQQIIFDDGAVNGIVKSVEDNIVTVKIDVAGSISNLRKVTLPDACFNLPVLTKQDVEDLKFLVDKDIDAVAVSFTRSAEDIDYVRKILPSNIMIIAKIENSSGVNNINEIIEAADGIMVARGDLGVEIPLEKVPVVQKHIIHSCNRAGKPVIVATQMLESMVHAPRPTRAEASDVANAILDGADCVMLSAETAVGKYPVQAVNIMAKIASEVDPHTKSFVKLTDKQTVSVEQAISSAVAVLASDINVDAIITATASGFTARVVSRFRPKATIIGVAHSKKVMRQLQLTWGVKPCVFFTENIKSHETVYVAIKSALKEKLISPDNTVITTAGVDTGKKGSTNLIEVHHVADFIKSHKHNK